MKAISLLVLGAFLLLSSGRSSAHGGITIDGDCSTDWGSAVPGTIHTSQVVAGPGGSEWVYLGAPGDARDDTGGTSSNNDIVEVRLTGDSTHLYFCVKMANITNLMLPNINIAIDTDHSASDTGLNWAGDESCITCGGDGSYQITNPANYIEHQFNAHYNNSQDFGAESELNLFNNVDIAPGAWFPSELNTVAASIAADSIEGKIAWAFLGCPGVCSELSINLTSYRNEPGDNESIDTTFALVEGDGIDVMGGVPGTNQNAWDREFSDGVLSSFYTVHFDLPTAIGLQAASARVQPDPNGILAVVALFLGVGLILIRQRRRS